MTADAREEEAINALPAGTRFGELEILGTLGVGGFGIVYLARDHSLEREIAIKEYMPSQFAMRDGRSQVSVRSASMRDTFELGRRSFVNEAKLLARFDHPSLLKVYRFWEANGTAYMAMPRLSGQNLRTARKTQPTPPPEAWVRRIFDAVLGGLAVLHAQQVWHRDIAPDNIFLPADGSPPILLDFGAARQAIGDRTQVFTAILKPSFAPIEQYAESTLLRQGPWTDFYALAAAMHELLTGRPPPPATARAMGDELAPLRIAGYSPAFLAGLDWALRMPPHQRPQSAADWREVIDGRREAPAALPAPAPRVAAAAPAAPAPAEPLDLAFADTVQGTPSQFDDPAATVVVPQRKRDTAGASQPPAASAPARQGRVLIAGLLAALLLLGLFVLQLRGERVAPDTTMAADAASAAASGAASLPAAALAEPPASAAGIAAALPASPPLAEPARTTPALVARPAVSAPPSRREPAPKPVVTEKAGDFRPLSRNPANPGAEPAAPTPTGAARAASVAAPAAEPRTAGEACGGRVLFARAWCIDRQCEKPIYQNDPECVKLREIRSSRNNAP